VLSYSVDELAMFFGASCTAIPIGVRLETAHDFRSSSDFAAIVFFARSLLALPGFHERV
jgi:hypothetical protein